MLGTIIQIALTGITTGIVAFFWRRDMQRHADLKTLYVVAVARNKQLEAENATMAKQIQIFAGEFSKGAIAHAFQDQTIARDGDPSTVVDALVDRLQTPLGGFRSDRGSGDTAKDVRLSVAGPSGTVESDANPKP